MIDRKAIIRETLDNCAGVTNHDFLAEIIDNRLTVAIGDVAREIHTELDTNIADHLDRISRLPWHQAHHEVLEAARAWQVDSSVLNEVRLRRAVNTYEEVDSA